MRLQDITTIVPALLASVRLHVRSGGDSRAERARQRLCVPGGPEEQCRRGRVCSTVAVRATCTVAEPRSANMDKNRYIDILAFSRTRVILQSDQQVRPSPAMQCSSVDGWTLIPWWQGHDYINANYVHAGLEKNAYIAAQGPLRHTAADFWQMIWEVARHGRPHSLTHRSNTRLKSSWRRASAVCLA